MSQVPPTEREYTLQEAAETVGREYAYTCTVVRDLDLGHEEPRRPGSKGPLRRLLWASEIERLKAHFAGHESRKEVPRRMGTYRFKLIRAVKGQNVQVKWTEENPDGSWDNHSLTSEDPARPELYEALTAFSELMATTHRLQQDDEHEVVVLGLHYQRDKDGYLNGVALEARVQLTESTWWSVKSVSLGVREKEEGGILNTIEYEAGLYINGSRAQLQLEFGKSDAERVVEAVMDTMGDPENQLTRRLQESLSPGVDQVTISSGGRSVTLEGRPEKDYTPA